MKSMPYVLKHTSLKCFVFTCNSFFILSNMWMLIEGCMWGDDIWRSEGKVSRRVHSERSGQILLPLPLWRGKNHYVRIQYYDDVNQSCSWNASVWIVISGSGSASGTCHHGTGTAWEFSRNLPSGCYALSPRILPGQKCRWDLTWIRVTICMERNLQFHVSNRNGDREAKVTHCSIKFLNFYTLVALHLIQTIYLLTNRWDAVLEMSTSYSTEADPNGLW